MISIDFTDKRSISEQIVCEVIDLAARGLLPAGSPLPSVRALATELSINPNTVQKAYAELERKGIIVSVRGRGSLIAENGGPLRELSLSRAEKNLAEAVKEAKRLGIECGKVCERVKQLYRGEGGSLND